MRIKRDEWKSDQTIVEEWLEQQSTLDRNNGIEARLENLQRNTAAILLLLDRDRIIDICEDK